MGKDRHVIRRGGVLASALLLSAHPALANLPMEQHMRIQATIQKDPDLARLPSIRIDSILAAVPVDDRLNADTAFDRPFTEALQQGMTWYLAQRGLRLVAQGEDLRLAGTIDRYEGFKGWGHWGVDVGLGFKVFRGTERLPSLPLKSLLKYSDDDEIRDEEQPKYKEQGLSISFGEVLFTRIGIDLCEKLIDGLKEREPQLMAPAAPGSTSVPRGTMSIGASVPDAEVRVDGQLVGTVPLVDLPLTEGHHSIEVRKKGFKTWKEDVLIFGGVASHLVAELEAESGQK